LSALVLLASLQLAPAAVADLIRAGDAGSAHHLLVEEIDDERAAPGSAETALYADLLRYLRCDALGTSFPAGAGAGLAEARTMLGAELVRLARHRREHRLSGPEAWLANGRLRWKADKRRAGKKMIDWPPEDERWSDELPVIAPLKINCDRVTPPPVDSAQALKKLLTDEAEAMRSLRLQLAPNTPVRVAVILDEAIVRARLEEWPEVWVLVRLLDEEAALANAGPLSPPEQAEAAVLAGLAAEHDERDAEALRRWNRAAELPLSQDLARFVDVHRQRHLIASGQLREARALLDRYTEVPGELGRYLRYRNALARFQTGDEGGVLAMARSLLGKHSIAENATDPVSRATEELVYLQLARWPFSPAQIEVVESIGLVREMPRRMEALGQIALERGRPALAIEIFRWLLSEQPGGYTRPIYLGRIAAAAAAVDDAVTFKAAFSSLVEETIAVPPPPPKPKAGERPRRVKVQKKSIEWDRQILLATRDAVAPLVARKSWPSLKVLVDELQRYLRAAKSQPIYAELTELYRLASTQLPVGPRAYAEKIGADHQPVWLGEVTLDRPRSLVAEPELPLPELLGPVTLLCLPDGKGVCRRWLGPPEPPAKPAKPGHADAR
jgi:hypothetical protein